MLPALVWIFSSFLDNIAGALIGGAIAHQVFRAKVTSDLSRQLWPLQTPAARGA